MARIDELTIYSENNWSKLKPINLSKIQAVDFPEEQYYPFEEPKQQTVLHHTVSGDCIRGDVATWLSDASRIATCIIVGTDGVAYQCFSSKYWAHHLGIPRTLLQERGFDDWASRNVKLNKESIAIEIDNWGQLEKVESGKYRTVYGNIVSIPDTQVIKYNPPYRGEIYFQRYNVKQLKTVGELLLFWKELYGIPLDYKGDKMFDINDRALGGEPGVWTHTSYRPYPDSHQKWDCHPDPNLKAMLRTIAKL
jgi:hypothetical protein